MRRTLDFQAICQYASIEDKGGLVLKGSCLPARDFHSTFGEIYYNAKVMKTFSMEEEFLARLARGGLVSEDEYNQIAEYLPERALAGALVRRFENTQETRMLVQAARIYLSAGDYYQALEACSRAPRLQSLQGIVQQVLPHIRAEYPDSRLVGKLLENAFLVIDLSTGRMDRFPPLMPAS